MFNLQSKKKDVYVIEVNPRASRTVPFVSKAIGVPLAKYATRLMLGEKLSSLGFEYHAPKEIMSRKRSSHSCALQDLIRLWAQKCSQLVR